MAAGFNLSQGPSTPVFEGLGSEAGPRLFQALWPSSWASPAWPHAFLEAKVSACRSLPLAAQGSSRSGLGSFACLTCLS